MLGGKDHAGAQVITLAATQLALLVVAILGARAESDNVAARLGWRGSGLPASTIALAMLGTLRERATAESPWSGPE